MPEPDLALLRSFSVVARTGSLSTAAVQVGRTQSALSMQMRRLEDLTGHILLHRTGVFHHSLDARQSPLQEPFERSVQKGHGVRMRV